MATVLVGISTIAAAQVAPPIISPSEQPGRERERFTQPPAPRAEPGGPAISLPSTVAPPEAAVTKLIVRSIRVSGSTVYESGEFEALYKTLVGRKISLQAIYDLAQAITTKYGKDGYVLSRAIVPPQELDPAGASIRIEIVEGWINKVEWPEKLGRYRDFFSHYTAKITSERPINIRTLERYLLLAGDLPGLKLSTTLKPSEKEVGASTLVVEVTEKPLDVSARVDNRGTKARGPIQYLGSVTLNNVFGQHESLGVSYASVPRSKELKYVGLNYRHVLTNEGLTAFANGSYSWGRPGTAQLEQFDFATRSTLVEVGLAYPFVRTRERNLTLSGLAFMSDSNADVLREPYNVDRLRGVRVKLDADNADSSQGINQLNITFSQGFEGLGGTSNDNPLASRAAGRVDFAKLEGSWSRTQGLLGNFSAHLAIYGQYAFTSLLASEQCGYGGRFFGRAYDPSQLLGDHCWQGVAELRYDLPVAQGVLSQVQLYGFTDYGKLYTIVPSEGTAPTIQGASAGAGVRLAWGNFLNIDLTTARAIEGPRDDWRFFFTAVARY